MLALLSVSVFEVEKRQRRAKSGLVTDAFPLSVRLADVYGHRSAATLPKLAK